MYKVYLSGPISGLDFETAIGWTDYAKNRLDDLSIVEICGYRPLRGKKFLKDDKEKLSAMGYEHNPISTPQGIVGRDRYDVMSADAILVNVLGAKEKSIGTIFEVAWAFLLQKPVVLVMEKEGNCHQHAFMCQACTYWVHDLDYGIELVRQILVDD